MKKILISIGVIAVVATIVAYGTGAFFSDTETSTGNTFTAGSIDLTIDSSCSYNGLPSTECGNWQLKDLNPTADRFFNFSDIKPGDTGVNIISLHVNNNDAWMCLNITNKQDNDNGLTEPEDIVDDTPGIGEGELSEFLSTFVWWDADQNGAFDTGEAQIDNGDLKTVDMLPLADSQHMPAITGGQTKYLGFAWCAGRWVNTPTPGQPFVCDGLEMGDIVQTDSFMADLAFVVEQARNNADFICQVPETPPITSEEICGDEIDNDDDGQVDENCELFFSEYVEGSSNNKALEIYNPTSSAVDLTGYKIEQYFNGSSTASNIVTLPSVSLAAGDVYVVCNSNFVDPPKSIVCDNTTGSIQFNGDDAVVLKNGTTIVDVIGQIGFDPGSQWGFDPISTENNTIVRKCSINKGDNNGTDTFDPSFEWLGYVIDTFGNLGSHICP
ncbi:MAG: TasA family protein [Patescibacteria group bacterium]